MATTHPALKDFARHHEARRLRQLANRVLNTWPGSAHERMLSQVEGQLISASMSLARDDVECAAQLLGITRLSLGVKLAKHRIERPAGRRG